MYPTRFSGKLWQNSYDLNQIDEDVEADVLEMPRSGVVGSGAAVQLDGTGVRHPSKVQGTDHSPASRQDIWLLF